VTAGVLGAIVAFLAWNGPEDGWAWSRIWGEAGYRPMFLGALKTTLGVSVAALCVAALLGLAGGLARISRRVWLSQLATVYVELVRGTPLLVQLFIAAYCVRPALGIEDAELIGTLTLGFFAGAYVTEIVRASVESIDPGQAEAALSQGMTRAQALRHVILPQALRRMVPPMTGEFVNLVKDSSLLSMIGVMELAMASDAVRSRTLRPFEVFLPIAVLYLAITFPLSRLARRLELRTAAP
jgi:polar amino acid transport system permease protein